MERCRQTAGQPHPLPEPRWNQPLTADGLQAVYSENGDFRRRTVGAGTWKLTLCYIEGLVRLERVSDYILRPLAQDGRLAGASREELPKLLQNSVLYNVVTQPCDSMDKVVADLTMGWCVLFLPGGEALTLFVGAEDRRSVAEPDNEPVVKGARDSFVENLRANTAMVRRRVRVPELRMKEYTVGRQSLTAVDVLWMEGIADPGTVERVKKRIDSMDIDGIRAAGDLEEYLSDRTDTAFPLSFATQRPDRFCGGLLAGRVGVLCEGQSVGWLLPGTVDCFFGAMQDRTGGWITATGLRLLRYVCMFVTLLLPGLYVALVTYQPEVIPVRLAQSIVRAKQQVPFSTLFEVLIMLIAFEVLQEAGLRLPGPIGQTVSILGGLVVGSAAVEAKIVSPAVLIAVALAGIAGYTVPVQDFANALRLWRFGFVLAAGAAGLAGLVLGGAVLTHHLAGLESFGVPYLAPFVTGEGGVLRKPLPKDVFRRGIPRWRNRRRQR
ncbi:MAG: spore germination protein [Oscillospiraceae bacterium]|nr:spore germination protein [Oscillospiraceae bacterium]